MPEIDSEIIFNICPINIAFHEVQDGDTLILNSLELTKEQAASLSWLINHSCERQIQIQIGLLEE